MVEIFFKFQSSTYCIDKHERKEVPVKKKKKKKQNLMEGEKHRIPKAK